MVVAVSVAEQEWHASGWQALSETRELNAPFLWNMKSAIQPTGIVSASPTEAAKGDVIITANAHKTSLTIEPRKPLSSRKRSVFWSGHKNSWISV